MDFFFPKKEMVLEIGKTAVIRGTKLVCMVSFDLIAFCAAINDY